MTNRVLLKGLLLVLLLQPLLVLPNQATAQGVAPTGIVTEAICPSADTLSSLLLTNVCWECLFPVRIMGVTVMNIGGNSAPSRAASGACFCPGCGIFGTFGVTVGMYQPARIVETVSTPMCFPSLGGITMPNVSPFASDLSIGTRSAPSTPDESRSRNTSFQHFHYYSLPILAILGLIDIFDCLDSGITDFDLLFLSETFPNWNNDTLSTFLNAESILFGNPAALLAQPIDCLSANVYDPRDSLFWMMGCWGSTYPLGGSVSEASPLTAASLRVSRAVFMLHRIGLARRQGGNDAVCEGVREPIMTKSMFRKQHYWPIPETTTSPSLGLPGDGSPEFPIPARSFLPTCCHALGTSRMLSGEFRSIPGRAEDQISLLWRWNDCCVGVCI